MEYFQNLLLLMLCFVLQIHSYCYFAEERLCRNCSVGMVTIIIVAYILLPLMFHKHLKCPAHSLPCFHSCFIVITTYSDCSYPSSKSNTVIAASATITSSFVASKLVDCSSFTCFAARYRNCSDLVQTLVFQVPITVLKLMAAVEFVEEQKAQRLHRKWN